LGVGDIGRVVLGDRKLLSRNGFVVVTLVVERGTGQVLSGPEIISRGFVYVRESEQLLERARAEVLKAAQYGGERAVLSNRIRDTLSKFVYNETKRRPLILPVVMEV